jgi:hypothetical protein
METEYRRSRADVVRAGKEETPVRISVVVLIALCTAACGTIRVQAPSGDGTYTLEIPGDALLRAQSLQNRAAARAETLCPNGWTTVSEEKQPAELFWQIRCNPVVATP